MMKLLIKIVYFLVVTSLFVLGFYQNEWQAISDDEVVYRRDVSEIYIMGRLVKSRQSGIFSAGGLLGIGDVAVGGYERRVIENQNRKYNKGTDFSKFWTYKSHPGFQGVIYSTFDAWTNFAPSTNLFVFRLGISLFLSMILSAFCLWVISELGWLASISVAIYILISKWLALLGGNLFWSLWSFYLPLLVISIWLRTNEGLDNARWMFRFSVIVFVLSLVKILFSGFEFITSALLMTTVPFVYYAVLNRWKKDIFIGRMISLSISLVGSVLVGLAVLCIQIKMDLGSFQKAVNHIIFSWNNRTYGSEFIATGKAATMGDVIERTTEVIRIYIDGYAFSLSNRLPTNMLWAKDLVDGRYSYLLILFAIATCMIFVLNSFSKKANTDRKGLALVVTTWYSILGPLSWLLIFRDHAFGHAVLDFIVWQMPFTLYGFALVGFSLSSLIKLKYQVTRTDV
ncbi:MAG: hypothetical protein IPP66_21425 [Anaerolineales bacterium]|nr:hypothetical protein [Anaerolineales bacterium]